MKAKVIVGAMMLTLILGILSVVMTGCNDKEPNTIDLRLMPGVWEVVSDGNKDVFQRGGFAEIRVSSDASNENPHGYLTTFFLTVGGIVKHDEVYSWSIRDAESRQPLVDLIFEGQLDSEDSWDGCCQYRIVKLTDSHMLWQRNSIGDESIIKLRRRTDIDMAPTKLKAKSSINMQRCLPWDKRFKNRYRYTIFRV